MNMKGSLPLIILQILSQGAKHGYGIAKEIKQQSDGAIEISEGTIWKNVDSSVQKSRK
jgi:DNA-binding PadR family transcriptional regulator